MRNTIHGRITHNNTDIKTLAEIYNEHVIRPLLGYIAEISMNKNKYHTKILLKVNQMLQNLLRFIWAH